MKIIKWTQWIWVYVLWMITAGLGLLCMLTARSLSVSLIYVFSTNMWMASVIDKFVFLALGIALLAFIIFTEFYYRGAVLKNILRKRFFLVTSIELFFLFGAHLISILIASRSGGWYGRNFFLPAIELIGGIILFILQYRLRKKDIHGGTRVRSQSETIDAGRI